MTDRPRLGRLGAELVVVVLGVMIALAADNWRQGLEEQGIERRYVERLTEEVRQTIEAVVARKESLIPVAASAYELAASMEGEAPPLSDDAFLEALFRATQIGFSRQEFTDVTYRELVASGNLALLRDPELREGVVEFYRLLDTLVDRLEGLAEMVPVNDRVAELTGYFPYAFDVHCIPTTVTECGEVRSLTAGDRGRLLGPLRQDDQLVLDLRHVNASLVLTDLVFANTLSVGEELVTKLERAR